MKQFSQAVLIAAVVLVSHWLYLKQFGAVPFLLLSVFLFYKAHDEWSGRAKKRRAAKGSSTPPPVAAQKKAEITT